MAKHLLMIEANTTGTGMQALTKARDLGFAPLFLTNQPARYKGLEQTGCPTLVCDTNSVPALLQFIATLLGKDEILGVTTTSEFYLEIAAHLAVAYGVPGNSPLSMQTCRNKALTRLRLAEAGIEQPRFALVSSTEQISHALETLDGPYVVKPVDDTGSYGVLLCQTAGEVTRHAQSIFDTTTNVRGQQTTHLLLIEEYLDAPEFSVEMFTWQGKTITVGITEKRLLGLPHFVEQRHIFPANLALNQVDATQHTVRRALEEVNITLGATHTEVKLTERGCAIIEINARPAGGMIPELIHLVSGIDLLEQQLQAVVGAAPNLASKHHGWAGIQFLTAPVEGRLEQIKGTTEALRLDGIKQVTLTATPGRQVCQPCSAYDRLGYIIAQTPTYEQVVSCLDEALSQLDLCISPVP